MFYEIEYICAFLQLWPGLSFRYLYDSYNDGFVLDAVLNCRASGSGPVRCWCSQHIQFFISPSLSLSSFGVHTAEIDASAAALATFYRFVCAFFFVVFIVCASLLC